MQERNIVVIGAGLTGLSTAFNLKQKGRDVLVLEKQHRIGGQINTYSQDGFTFERRGFDMRVVIPEASKKHITEDVAKLCPTGALVVKSEK